MTEIVPADEIETKVGARRHPTVHLARAVSAEQRVYILHSEECRDSGIDLRECLFSLALDLGPDLEDWEDHQDTATALAVNGRFFLVPDHEATAELESARWPGVGR